MGIVAAGVALGFLLPGLYFITALTAVKYAFDRNLPFDGVAPHGAVETLGNAGAGQGNIPALF